MIMGAWGLGRKRGWTNPYVTDGLIAMWDGEWNAGGGVSDPTTGKILDLCGGEPFVVDAAKGTLTGKSLLFSGRSATCNRTMTDFGTVECVARLDSGRIIFYGCTKNGTTGLGDDFSAIRGAGAGEFCEFCFPQGVSRSVIPIQYNVAYTLSSSGSNRYRDGVLVESTLRGNTWGNQTVIDIGGRVSTSNYDGAGELFALRVYSRDLTADEIAANCAIDKQRFNLP